MRRFHSRSRDDQIVDVDTTIYLVGVLKGGDLESEGNFKPLLSCVPITFPRPVNLLNSLGFG
jgi:hypothetical protein